MSGGERGTRERPIARVVRDVINESDYLPSKKHAEVLADQLVEALYREGYDVT